MTLKIFSPDEQELIAQIRAMAKIKAATQGVLEEGVHFIQKPFSARGLAAKVREVLAA